MARAELICSVAGRSGRRSEPVTKQRACAAGQSIDNSEPAMRSARRGDEMSDWEESANRHAAELVRLTLKAADQGAKPLPEDELAKLGMLIATERQLLIDSISGLLQHDEPEAAASPGVAEFDAGFLYGLMFSRALDDAKEAMDRVRRGRLLKFAKNHPDA